jgi:hypothetical protein
MNANLRGFATWIAVVLVLLPVLAPFPSPAQQSSPPWIAFTRFPALVDRGNVRAVDIDWPEIWVSTTDGRTFWTLGPNDHTLVQRLQHKQVVVTMRPAQP